MKNGTEFHGFICGPSIYEYKGMIFEYSVSGGPWRLTKNWEPYKRVGETFWKLWEEFHRLPEKEQVKYKIGGGCQRF